MYGVESKVRVLGVVRSSSVISASSSKGVLLSSRASSRELSYKAIGLASVVWKGLLILDTPSHPPNGCTPLTREGLPRAPDCLAKSVPEVDQFRYVD